MNRCRLLDTNKIYSVLEYKNMDSSGVELTLIDDDGIRQVIVVANHLIEWIEE